MRAPASATASAVLTNCRSDSTEHGPAITTKSPLPTSMSPMRTTVLEHSGVFVTRGKPANCLDQLPATTWMLPVYEDLSYRGGNQSSVMYAHCWSDMSKKWK